ncbi:MAG TPA: 2,3-bisphosphoglycerate-independent phosphoglycerate mutase [Polyangia bacterium]|jgi:2,3-bisphosphoglycerate-independent phosphoglycerate mutase|nr:2,3-bisphosphoglycerate-independent phosphoglycerate mutase [Polyangia bacterium]HWE30965.1 2,3-bisphosphoglycerate-independent phosphoglycerate mutase [Polyangia bacterium]
MTKPIKRTVLVVLDGFGERADRSGNAVRLAQTPSFDRLYREYPHTLVNTSGLAVGLPEGQMGNSEVGHMNMGSGRIVYQDLTRINKSISDGDFFENGALVGAIDSAKARGKALHLLGLTSPGGVHSSLEHAYAILELCKRRGLDKVYWHAFTDGRDTPPKSAAATLREIETKIAQIGVGKIATIIGRYFAMDRDNRWDRVEKAYRMLTAGEGERATDAVAAVENRYASGENDEFLKPIVLDDKGLLSDGDSVVFFNFRADRAREISRALNFDDFDGFARPVRPKLGSYVCMCQYDASFGLAVAFPPQSLKMILGEYLAQLGLAQFRTAETEKYAHVTFFFNGGREEAFAGEERRLVQSPRDVATYDLKPEMNAADVADGVCRAIESEKYAFMLVNFANPDMVGHTGVLPAAISAVDAIDACIGRLISSAEAHDTAVVITADHGNCETMLDENGHPHTAHTTNPVPFIVCDARQKGHALVDGGRLCDVAPTVLSLMGLPQPKEMEGHSLLAR